MCSLFTAIVLYTSRISVIFEGCFKHDPICPIRISFRAVVSILEVTQETLVLQQAFKFDKISVDLDRFRIGLFYL